MNSPVLTPVFHQFLETLLREKNTNQKVQTPQSLCLASISFSVPQACHHTQHLWLLCWDRCLCSARQLCLGTRVCLPTATFSHSAASEGALQMALGCPTAALQAEHPGQQCLAAATHKLPQGLKHKGIPQGNEYSPLVVEDPALPLEYVSRDT